MHTALTKRNTEVKQYLNEMMDAMCTDNHEQNQRNIELMADQIYDTILHRQEQNEQARLTIKQNEDPDESF